MKKLLALALALVTVLSMTACGLTGNQPSGNGTSGNSTTDPGTQQTDDPGTESGTYPRYTGYDGTEYVAAANLQNCHIFYTYDAECKGDPSSVQTGEYMTCLNRQYYRTYTLSGYEDHMDGDAKYSEPDNHIALVLKDGKWTVYDFYLKIIATDGEEDYYSNVWGDGGEVTSFSKSTLRQWELDAENFVSESEYGFTQHLDAIEGKSICGKPCNGWMRYTTYENAGYELNTYDYRLWVDPETHLTLRYEWYVDRYNLDEVAQIFEVTSIELNCVTQEAFDKKIADLVESFGGEGAFKKMIWGEYWDLLA